MNSKLLMSILLWLIVFSFSSNTVLANPCIVVDQYEISPEVLMPGDKGVLTITIKNMDGSSATTTTVTTDSTTDAETDNDYEGSTLEQTDTVTDTDSTQTTSVTLNGVSISEIWVENASDDNGNNVSVDLRHQDLSYLTPSSYFNVEFEIVADKNISIGNYFPNVHIDLKNANYDDVTFPILVKIQNSSLDFYEKNVPSLISAGGTSDLTFTVRNNGDQEVKSISVKPYNYGGLDFSPKNYNVGSLEAGGSQDIIFSVNAKKTGIGNTSFLISYKNGDNFHNKTFQISLKVIENSDVEPVIYSVPSKINKGSSSRFRLEVFNAKSETISGVVVTPVSDEKIVFSPSKYFIGSMDSDDVFSAVFDVSTENLNVGENYSVGFKVTYKQDDYYYESSIVETSFKVIESDTKESSFGFFVNVGIVVFIVVVFLFAVMSFLKRKRRI